jgi:hypothetical protein
MCLRFFFARTLQNRNTRWLTHQMIIIIICVFRRRMSRERTKRQFRPQCQPRRLAEAFAPVALDQLGHVPAGDVPVRDHRHHAQPRLADRGQAAHRAQQAQLPEALTAELRAYAEQHDGAKEPLPAKAEQWLADTFKIQPGGRAAEWSVDEVYLPMPKAGGDAGCASAWKTAPPNLKIPTAAGSPG